MKKLLMMAIMVIFIALTCTSSFARTFCPQDIFGTWTVSGRLVLYKKGSHSDVDHQYQIQPFKLEIGDRPADQVYGEFSQEQKDLAYQALKAFLSMNHGNYACGDRDFNQIVAQLGRPLYLAFEQDAEQVNGHFIKQYEVPNTENIYYADHFKIDWQPGGYLWFTITSNWTENGIYWSPGIRGGKFRIAEDCRSAHVDGESDVFAVGACKATTGTEHYHLELQMNRCDCPTQ